MNRTIRPRERIETSWFVSRLRLSLFAITCAFACLTAVSSVDVVEAHDAVIVPISAKGARVRQREIHALTTQLQAGQMQTGRAAVDTAVLFDLATRRAIALRDLAERDPRAAYAVVVSQNQLGTVSRTVQSQIESRVSLEGELSLIHDDASSGLSTYQMSIVSGSRRYPIRFVLSPSDVRPGDRVQVEGVQLPGDGFILADNVRRSQGASMAAVTSLGSLKTAVILLQAGGATSRYADKSVTASLFFSSTSGVSARAFVSEASYGQATIVGASGEGSATDVYGPYTIGTTSCDFNTVTAAGITSADPDLDYNNYDRLVFNYENPACDSGGVANIGANSIGVLDGRDQFLSRSMNKNGSFGSAVLNGRIGTTALHEYGHNLGLFHSNSLQCGLAAIGTAGCSTTEYGDPTDVMGNGRYGHYNSFHKDRLGWLTSARSQTAITGTYILKPFESSTDELKVLRIPRTRDQNGVATSVYYLEYHRPSANWADFGRSFPNFVTGVTVYASATLAECVAFCGEDFSGPGGGADTIVVDAHPGSFGSRRDVEDAPLQAGETFNDTIAGISFRISSADASGATIVATVSTAQRSIQSSVFPPGAGTVSGVGTYTNGQNATLTATANPGYVFSTWRESQDTQSYANPYLFTIVGDRTFEAVFTVSTTLPSNDAFASATTISTLPTQLTATTSAATRETGESSSTSCGSLDRTVWYRYPATSTGNVTVSTIGSNFDTVLSVYTGGSVSALTSILCNDQIDKTDQSRLTFQAVSGTTYYIQVGSYNTFGTPSGGSLTIQFTAETAPSNDAFSLATVVTSLPASYSIATAGANIETSEPGPADCGASIGHSVWFQYQPTTTTNVAISTAKSPFSTVTNIYTGSTLSALTLFTCGSRTNSNTDRAQVNARLEGGTTYYVQIAGSVNGYQAPYGTLQVDFSVDAAGANDAFDSATTITSLPLNTGWTATPFTTETGEPGVATSATACGTVGRTAWYKYTPTSAGAFTVSTGGSTTFNIATVYTGSTLAGLTPVVCADGTVSSYAGQANVSGLAGVTYYIQVGASTGYLGSVALNIFSVGATTPLNDAFAAATDITSLPAQFVGLVTSLTTETNETLSGQCGPISRTLWWKYTPTSDGLVTISTLGSDFDSMINVYAGPGYGALREPM